MHVSVRPTTWPARDRRHARRQRRLLHRLRRADRDGARRGPRCPPCPLRRPPASPSGRRRPPTDASASRNGNETFRCTSWPPMLRRTSRTSPRSSTASTSISTGSAAIHLLGALTGPQPADRRRRGVRLWPGSRWVIMRRTSLPRTAVSVTCSRPKPTETESRVEMIAPPLAASGARVVGLDPLLAERPLQGHALDAAQPRGRLRPRVGQPGHRVRAGLDGATGAHAGVERDLPDAVEQRQLRPARASGASTGTAS